MAQVKILRDGTVEAMVGSQDIGGGARTVVAILTSRAFGYLPLSKINVKIGDSDFGKSAASAGSGTTGALTGELTGRNGAIGNVQKQLFDLVGAKLNVAADQLEIRPGGVIGPKGKGGGMKWDDAAGLIKDSIIGFAPTIVEPGYQWAIVREDGTIDQASEEDYKA
jgi:xanthine dehydrogenase YagR molybdenum-binding subunit